MKKTIIILTAVIILVSCNNSSTGYHKKAPDTTRTVALYVGNNGGIAGDFVYRITRDTSYFDTLNSTTAKRMFKRDTVYFVPVPYPLVDSANKPLLDSTGKPKTTIRYVPINSRFVICDYNKTF